MTKERPLYNKALKALQAAHDACMKNKDTVLGMSTGPFSGVNEALEIIAELEEKVMVAKWYSKLVYETPKSVDDKEDQE